MTLDDKGRCCGRKPIRYVGKYAFKGPHRFCDRCCRAYHLTQNRQIENWAWREVSPGQFKPMYEAKA